MKTLQIIGSKQLGGAERWFRRFVDALAARGHAVHAAVRRGSELDGPYLGDLRYTALAMRTVWDPLSKRAIRQLVEREEPVIVQTYMGRATRLTRLPRACDSVHVARLGGYYKLEGYRHADAWIGNTRGLCDYLVQAGFPADRVFHIYNFVNPAPPPNPEDTAALSERLALTPEDLLLVMPGRCVPVKGHDVLLAALGQLPGTLAGRRVRLALVGDGPLLDALKTQARQLGIEDRVIWAGWQQDVAPWYAIADLVVLPSRENETLGNVILEAWAHRRPLLCTRFRGAREIATHGQDAWCVPCDDAAALADGLRTLVTDQSLQQQIGGGGEAKLAGNFSEEIVMAEYEAVYQHLVDHPAR
jgi:hypothetical protein